MQQLEGMVESIIYENSQNGYTVCDVSFEGCLYTLTGYMPGLSEGEYIVATGDFKVHPEYGEQFSVSFYERRMPKTENETELYLASGVLPHIGKSTARKIVEMFGKDALSIIEKEPERLTEIKGISPKKADEINRKFIEQIGLKNIIMFFQKYDVSPSLAVKAYKNLGSGVVELVKNNPFVLSHTDGFTFKICDKICESMKIPQNFPPRVEAAIRSVLMNAAYLSGHTYLPVMTLVGQAKLMLGIDMDEIEDAVTSLSLKGELVIERQDDYDAAYLKMFHDAEKNVALRLKAMSGMIYEVKADEARKMIADAELESEIILADAQREAILNMFENSALVITGGPGTGKTTIIKTIIKIMEKQGKRIALTAPTGRAAKRMTEVCGVEAKTIHRLLENVPSEGIGTLCFARNEKNKLECDVLIVDEMSMVDVLLMDSLLLALPVGTRLIMVGDCDQLPAVGAGNVLRDIIESESVACIKLTEIFRQARESMIVVNAHRINNGMMPYSNDPDNDFFMMECADPERLAEIIGDLCERRIPKKYGVDSISQIQVLTPTRKTSIGVQNLNVILQERLNSPQRYKNEKAANGCIFRVGDKVMQNKNNYNIEWTRKSSNEKGNGVFNGDVGFVTEVGARSLTVMFDDKEVVYDFLALDELELAYAITVHKSQGSEFEVVIMPVFDTHRLLMTRNLLYTAITRAKRLVILVGKEEILKRFVDNDNIQQRYSGLREKLIIR